MHAESKIFDEVRIVQSDYDPLDTDPMNVIRMVSFHTEAGGTLYTGLDQRLDAKSRPHAAVGREPSRALRPRAATRCTHWKIDGKSIEPEIHVAIVRLVLPVRMTPKINARE